MTVLFFTVSHRGSISLPAAAPLISRYLYRKTNPVSAIESSLFTILCFFPTSQYQPHHLLYGNCHIPSGSYRLHSFLDCNRLPQDGEEGIYAVLITHPGLPGYATGVQVRILDIPTTMMDFGQYGDMQRSIMEMVSNILIEVLSTIAESERRTIRKRQAEGIAAAKDRGKHLGRPRIDYPNNWISVYHKWQNKEITAVEAMRELNMKKTSFYKLIRRYESSTI